MSIMEQKEALLKEVSHCAILSTQKFCESMAGRMNQVKNVEVFRIVAQASLDCLKLSFLDLAVAMKVPKEQAEAILEKNYLASLAVAVNTEQQKQRTDAPELA